MTPQSTHKLGWTLNVSPPATRTGACAPCLAQLIAPTAPCTVVCTVCTWARARHQRLSCRHSPADRQQGRDSLGHGVDRGGNLPRVTNPWTPSRSRHTPRRHGVVMERLAPGRRGGGHSKPSPGPPLQVAGRYALRTSQGRAGSGSRHGTRAATTNPTHSLSLKVHN